MSEVNNSARPVWAQKGDNALLWPFLQDDPRQTTALRESVHIMERGVNTCADKSFSILDLGCGEGKSYDDFKSAGIEFSWVGVDIADSPEVAKRNRDDLEFIAFDGVHIPLPDESVDIVYSRQVFEHVHSPKELLQQVQRVLKPGGWFVGSTSHLEPYHSRSFWNFTPFGFASFLSESGFSEITLKPGIDGITLISRRLLGAAGINLGHWFFNHESPLNFLIEALGRVGRFDGRRRCALKLEYCGHFIFCVKKT